MQRKERIRERKNLAIIAVLADELSSVAASVKTR
jgi:hypothetical protein